MYSIINPAGFQNDLIINHCAQDAEQIRRDHSNQVGFVPHPYRDAIQRRMLRLVYESDDKAWDARRIVTLGYPVAMIWWGTRGPFMTIHQLAVQTHARRIGLATRLMDEALSASPEVKVVKLRCRCDLEACDFWSEIGFEHVATDIRHNARRKKVRMYQASRYDVVRALKPRIANARTQPHPRSSSYRLPSAFAGDPLVVTAPFDQS